MPHALLVDDDISFASALSELIGQEDFDVSICGGVEEALAFLKTRTPDVVLVDLVLPDGNGIDLVHKIEALAAHTRVLVITGHAGLESTVAALRAGVEDYLTKPLDPEHLRNRLGAIKTDIARNTSPSSNHRRRLDGLGPLIGSSDVMQELYAALESVAPTDLTVFLYGESGTGKELAANAVHAASPRREQPFLALNCGAVSANLIASELFGHERGAFTDARNRHQGYFERADGGTLLLDEITEMPLELQVQLLRVLENRSITRIGGTAEIPVNVRIIAATNRLPRKAVEEGRLREDLLFRLMAFPVRLPPLRRRAGDARILAEHFLDELNRVHATEKTFTADALAFMNEYNWPGNVRELKNAINHAYILAEDRLQPRHFPEGMEGVIEADGDALHCPPATPIDRFEKRFILATLEHHDGNKRLAAETLGISLKTLYNRLNLYRAENETAQ